jgi:hypothetical protein
VASGSPVAIEHRSHVAATITLGGAAPRRPDALVDATIVAGPVSVYVDSAQTGAYLSTEHGECAGFINFEALEATLAVTCRTSNSLDSTSMMLTVTAALLAQTYAPRHDARGRGDRAVVGRRVAFGGRGESRQVHNGSDPRSRRWNYLSDDSVTLSRTADSATILLDGWP